MNEFLHEILTFGICFVFALCGTIFYVKSHIWILKQLKKARDNNEID